jgi:hypothetical protein
VASQCNAIPPLAKLPQLAGHARVWAYGVRKAWRFFQRYWPNTQAVIKAVETFLIAPLATVLPECCLMQYSPLTPAVSARI